MEKQTISLAHLQIVKEQEFPYHKEILRDARTAAGFMKDILGERAHECMALCCIDSRLKPTYIQIIKGEGTNNSIWSIPEIFKLAILSNAAGILLFRNRPSGEPEPSPEDFSCTRKVIQAGELLGIPVEDHIILGEGERYFSFREEGYLAKKDGQMKMERYTEMQKTKIWKYVTIRSLEEAKEDEEVCAYYEDPRNNVAGKKTEEKMKIAEEEAKEGKCKLMVWRECEKSQQPIHQISEGGK